MPRTNADDTLKREWYCEGCSHVFEGVDPPNECDVCGGTKFENGLDIACEGRPLPAPNRPATLQA